MNPEDKAEIINLIRDNINKVSDEKTRQEIISKAFGGIAMSHVSLILKVLLGAAAGGLAVAYYYILSMC